MKKIHSLFAFALTLILLCSCSGNITGILDEHERKEPTDEISGWSVLIYTCGESKDKAQAIFKELCFRDYPSNVNFVIQTDKTNDTYLQRFVAQKNSVFLKDQKPMSDSGNYETFKDFLSWGIENFPSEKYMLLIVGDGAGMNSLKANQNESDQTLSVEEISYAISLLGQTFDVIGFDGAYTASLEIASSLSPYADYMVASEEKCAGWDYRGLAECLIEYPFVSSKEISQIICDKYYEKCIDGKYDELATMSVIDLAHISQVTQAFAGMSDTMVDTTDSLDLYGALARNILNAQKCIGSNGVFDLGSMATAVAENVGQPAQEVKDAISNAVIYDIKGTLRPQSSGLCIYYPVTVDKNELNNYMASSASDNYKHFIKCISPDVDIWDKYISDGYEQSWAWCDYVGREFGCNSYIDENSKYSMLISGDINITKDVMLNKYCYYPDSNAYYSMGKDNNLVCDWSAQTYSDHSEYKLCRIRKNIIQMDLDDTVNDYGKIYTVPIIINDEIGEITVFNAWNSNKFHIMGVWQNGMLVKPSHKDIIVPLHNIKDEPDTQLTGKPIRGGLGFGISYSSLPVGSYIWEYELEDIYSKVRYAPSANITKTASGIEISQ